MTDEQIRDLAVQYARDITNGENLLKVQDSAQFLGLADEIFEFIKNGTVPS